MYERDGDWWIGYSARASTEAQLAELGELAAALEASLATEDAAQIAERMARVRAALERIRGLGAALTIDETIRRLADLLTAHLECATVGIDEQLLASSMR